MSNPFAAPASASGIQWSDLLGRLLVIEPKGVEKDIQTSLGAKDAVRADVHVIDGPSPSSHDDVLIFPRVLISQTSSKVGEMVLGRLGQGQAKPGQSAPWQIQAPSEQDIAAGVAWLEQRKTNPFASAAPAQAGTPAGQPPF
jgi:hypothetical protein